MSLFSSNIQQYHIDTLSKMKWNLNTLWTLEKWLEGDKIENKESKKLKELYYIKDNEVTVIGEDVYNGLLNMKEPKKKEKKNGVEIAGEGVEDAFEKWWKLFPASAQYEYRGHIYKSERVLKSNKQVCKQLYTKILLDTKIAPEVLYRCLEVEIVTRKEEGYNHWKKENKLQYMSGAEVYLRQGKYEGYVDREMPIVHVDKSGQNNMVGI